MLAQELLTVLYAIFNVVHYGVFALFFLCSVRIFSTKYAPYSAFYVASVALIQVIYDGCPLTDLVNFLAKQIGLDVIANQFIFIFFDWYWFSKILILGFSFLLYYQSYETWYKPRTVLDFTRVIRFSGLTSFLSRIKNTRD